MNRSRLTAAAIAALTLLLLSLTACDSPEPEAPPPPEPAAPLEPLHEPDPTLEANTEQAWQLGAKWLETLRDSAKKQHQAIESLLRTPGADAVEEARQAWLATHYDWQRLSPLLTLADSHPGLFGALSKARYDIAAFPMQPGYIDYLDNYPYSGIVNDMTVELTATNLRRQHGLTDDSDVILGFYAMKFLLWGEHGERPAGDFEERLEASDEEKGMGLTPIDLPNNRRRSLLLLLSNLLQDDLRNLQLNWQDPYSPLANPFYQLHANSRLQLLQDTTKYLLEDRLVPTLTQDAEDPFNLNGGDLSAVSIALAAVRELWLAGDEPLLNRLGDDAARTLWLEQLQETADRATSNSATEPDEAERQALAAQILALAELFQNPVLEP